jgi:hypothetical protein
MSTHPSLPHEGKRPKEAHASTPEAKYGPRKPKTPANGFALLADAKRTCPPGRGNIIRASQAELLGYDLDELLKPPKLHDLRWIRFDDETNVAAFAKFVREHPLDSSFGYARYPGVTGEEIPKALKVKSTFSAMLDEMQ